MTVETYDIEAGDILGDLPFPTGAVSASSDGVDTSDIDRWIVRGAARVNALLRRAKITPASVKKRPETLEVVRGAIETYAARRALIKAEWYDDPLPILDEEWKAATEQIRNFPDEVGDAFDRSTAVRSNAPDKKTDRTFIGKQW